MRWFLVIYAVVIGEVAECLRLGSGVVAPVNERYGLSRTMKAYIFQTTAWAPKAPSLFVHI